MVETIKKICPVCGNFKTEELKDFENTRYCLYCKSIWQPWIDKRIGDLVDKYVEARNLGEILAKEKEDLKKNQASITTVDIEELKNLRRILEEKDIVISVMAYTLKAMGW